MQCSGKAMSQDFMKSTRFHEICQISCEIRRISKDQQLPGMVRPMLGFLFKAWTSTVVTIRTFRALKLWPVEWLSLIGCRCSRQSIPPANPFLGMDLSALTKFVSLSIVPSQNATNLNKLTTNNNTHLTTIKLSFCVNSVRNYLVHCSRFFLKRWKFSWQFCVGWNFIYFVME